MKFIKKIIRIIFTAFHIVLNLVVFIFVLPLIVALMNYTFGLDITIYDPVTSFVLLMKYIHILLFISFLISLIFDIYIFESNESNINTTTTDNEIKNHRFNAAQKIKITGIKTKEFLDEPQAIKDSAAKKDNNPCLEDIFESLKLYATTLNQNIE